MPYSLNKINSFMLVLLAAPIASLAITLLDPDDPDGGITILSDSRFDPVLFDIKNDTEITRIAGTGEKGNRLDPANPTETQLDGPEGVAVDSNGRIFIADTGNHRVLEISKNGKTVTVIAGTGVKGCSPILSGFKATDIQLNTPEGVTVDRYGVIFIADTGNHRVLAMSKDGATVSLIAGVPVVVLNSPKGLSVSVSATTRFIDIVNTGNRRLVMILESFGRGSSTVPRIKVIDGGKIPATSSHLLECHGKAVAPDGSIIIADAANHRILQARKAVMRSKL